MLEIKTYTEYNKHLEAFKQKKLNLMVIVSRGGLGKTFMAEEALMEEAPLFFSGHVTPMELYKELYERTKLEKDVIVIFDDVDALMSNKTTVSLLKQICDTRETKTIRYSSSALRDMPTEYETNCKVLIMTNKLTADDLNMQALMTRSHLIHFTPSDIEILNNLKKFATDKEILKFIGLYAHCSKALNLRVYKRASELKESGLDWKHSIISDLEVDPQMLEVYELLQKYKTDNERVAKFSGGRATFYRKKKEFVLRNPELKYDITK